MDSNGYGGKWTSERGASRSGMRSWLDERTPWGTPVVYEERMSVDAIHERAVSR